jgi:PD-(D/E)XK endonuclease
VLTPDQKGAIAEAAILHTAIELGVGVAQPFGDERYDFVFDLRPELVRVQCKWARRLGDVVVVRCYSCRRTADGMLVRRYERTEVDAFAAYCPDVRRCYFLPLDVFAAQRNVNLRLKPARNNQAQGIHWADEYEFGARLGARGAIAQLGERLRGTQEVAGSSPAGSTSEAAHRAASPF